jgi:hypothetical protein
MAAYKDLKTRTTISTSLLTAFLAQRVRMSPVAMVSEMNDAND